MDARKQTAIRLNPEDFANLHIVKKQMQRTPYEKVSMSSAIRFALANQAAKGAK